MSAHKLSDVYAMAPGAVIIGGKAAIGAAGAVTSDDPGLSGGTVTQTASEAGRYTIAFTETWHRILAHGVTMIGPDDTAMPTTTGSNPVTRNFSNTGFDAQFVRTSDEADTDPADGTQFTWWALVAKV